MLSRSLIALAVAMLPGCGSGPEDRHAATPLGDYAVYAAALDSLVLRVEGDRRLVLLSPTVGDGPEGWASVEAMRDDADVPTDVRADFMTKNASRVALFPDSLALGVPITVVARDSIRALASDHDDGWAAIFAAFPGARGLVQLSRVGFSRDSTRALLYLGRTCGDLCGTGWKLQFRREPDDAWTIVAADAVWYH